ncbi:hypothetical protein BD779DRAFT_1543995, partial [Infundibulicybe gibba]
MFKRRVFPDALTTSDGLARTVHALTITPSGFHSTTGTIETGCCNLHPPGGGPQCPTIAFTAKTTSRPFTAPATSSTSGPPQEGPTPASKKAGCHDLWYAASALL